MSRVDVLAVMDTAAAAIEGSWAIYEGPKDLIAARNAVAELIDLVEDYLAAVDEADATYADEHDKAVREKFACRERVNDALAKVQP